MLTRCVAFSAAAAFCATAFPASGAPKSQILETRLPGWKVVRRAQQCSLVYTRAQYGFSVELSDSFAEPTIFFNRPTGGTPGSVRARVFLRPVGGSYAGEQDTALKLPGGFVLSDLPSSFTDALSTSNRLELHIDGKKRLDFAMANPAPAVSAVRSCHHGLLRSWGLDPAAYRTLARPPVPVGRHEWFRGVAELDHVRNLSRGGDAIVKFTVTPEGRAKDCTTVAPSGSAVIDWQTCSTIVAKARFSPAIGPTGQPVATAIAFKSRWVIF